MTAARSAVLILALLATSLVGGGVARAQPQELQIGQFEPGPVEAEPPFVEVLTFGVGEVIFEKFGHTAVCLRYHDPNRSPVCFNYGVTDFDAGSEMVWNFLRSQQQFWVEPSAYYTMIAFYEDEDRDIWVQTLPLTGPEARAIEARLWGDLDERRRFYVYDHFNDNCTTRIRDMIDAATGGRMRTDSDVRYPLTLRELGHRGLAELPALVAITDFIVGRELDARPTLWQAMFHPDVLRQQLEVRFGVPAEIVAKRHGPPFPTEGSTGRLPMLLIALAFTLPLLLATWRRRFERPALVWATLYLAAWGLVIYAIVIVSSISALRWNEAVFVLMPFDLALPFLAPGWRRRYARIRVVGLLLVSALVALGVLHQPLWIPILTAIMPLAIIAFGDRSTTGAGAAPIQRAGDLGAVAAGD